MADTTLMASANNSGCGGSTAFAAVVHAAMTAAGISFVIAVDPPPTLISVARGTRIIANVVLKADARRRAAGGQLNHLAGLHLGLDGLELPGGRGELLDLTLVALPVSILARQLEHPLLSLGHLLDPSLQRGEQRALADWKRDGGVALASIVRDLTALGELQHVVDGNDLVVLDGGDRMKAPAARVSRHANRGAAEHG